MGINRKSPVWEGINIILCVACFILIVWGTGKYGPGVTHDSVAYLYSAASLADGQGLQYFGYTSPFIQWPPMYSFILAVPEGLGLDPLVFTQYFNALVMALALWVGSRTVKRLTQHPMMPTLFILMGLTSFQLLRMAFYVWSEPLFILMSTCTFHLLFTRNHNASKSQSALIVMALSSAIACLTRYIGVVVVAVACLYLLVKVEGFRHKFTKTFLYGFVAVFPTVLYIIRNYLVSGTLVGMRSPSGISLSTNLFRAVKTIAGWLFPVVRNEKPLETWWLALLALVAIVVGVLVLVQLFKHGEKRAALVTLIGFCIFYSFYMAVSASKVAFDPISDRYMIPVMVPLLSLLVIAFDGVLSPLFSKRKAQITSSKWVWGGFTAAFLIFFLLLNGWILYGSTQKAVLEGAGGFNSDYWQKHGFLSQEALYSDSDMIYSNDPSAVHFLTGKPSHFPPKTFGIALYGYEAFLKESETYQKQVIIWFGEETSSTVYTPQMLTKDFVLTELSKTDTFTLYAMERKGL